MAKLKYCVPYGVPCIYTNQMVYKEHLVGGPYVMLQTQLSSTQSTCKDHSTGNVRPEARARAWFG